MIKTFIIHVSQGYEVRRQHIDNHLPQRGITDYEYMLRGDISDLTPNIRNHFFSDKLSLGQMSCFYKHYLVMKEALARKIEPVLVLEDDVILSSNFVQEMEAIEQELISMSNYYINIEEASNSVPFAVRKAGQRFYLCKVNKLCGGYIFDLVFAEKFVSYVESQKNDAPIDGMIGNLIDILQFNLYWTHPPLVQQGSKNGMFASELSERCSGIYPAIRNWFKDNYRANIRSHVSRKHHALFKDVKKY
ncbi:glycosyltransferase family 25 protein [Vibrio metschnikovii]|uniref:glycosyltransferase family 25 protein n=1 Tax=Vibrio metschnikovii TaxID=28172 RepID=UPI002FC7015E|nr:glycosyltransferase family 25 protein [Vibrio metschnikovii]EKO3721532.1 glycosyltransferase family 25 protein [Vibrio metschnikovii]EKO3724424.1 glycosyltransferase family 25 protein [Vibrio metschnikovii]